MSGQRLLSSCESMHLISLTSAGVLTCIGQIFSLASVQAGVPYHSRIPFQALPCPSSCKSPFLFTFALMPPFSTTLADWKTSIHMSKHKAELCFCSLATLYQGFQEYDGVEPQQASTWMAVEGLVALPKQEAARSTKQELQPQGLLSKCLFPKLTLNRNSLGAALCPEGTKS